MYCAYIRNVLCIYSVRYVLNVYEHMQAYTVVNLLFQEALFGKWQCLEAQLSRCHPDPPCAKFPVGCPLVLATHTCLEVENE